MSTSKPTAEWDKVEDSFYRKTQLYTSVFDTDLELENYLITGAPYSGALALHRNEDKIQTYRADQAIKSSIDIYSCSGRLIRRLAWDKGTIRGLGWSEDEKLIVVVADGSVCVFSDLTDDFSPFTLGQTAEEFEVVACRFWQSGFVALLGNNQLVSVSDYDEPKPKLLATPPSDEVISWTIVPPLSLNSRNVEVLLAIEQTIYVVDASDVEDRQLQNGPFRHICTSPNGRFIALYTDDGKVWVISSDFQEKLSEYDSKVRAIPKDMQWCGNDLVVLAWEDELHMVGPNGAAVKHYFDAWVQIVPDIDGVKLFTNDICEFISKVPEASEVVFKMGSTHPASVLLDAAYQLDQRSPKADDNIQLIRPNLADAVDTCIAAAGHEYSIHWQKELLKAASFGKTVMDYYNSDEFVNMSEIIRVLNAVRYYEIGMPLSYEQYMRLTPERLILRLINRQEYALALQISDYLNLPTERIYTHWASQKVRQSAEDEESICKAIVERVKGIQGISFEAIAQSAYDEGRHRLATKLLDHEIHAGKQVPLLLTMEEDTVALDKAIESGDTDLMLVVLQHLRAKLPLASFFRTINSRPIATALVETSARFDDRDLLKDLYYQDDRRIDGSNLLFAESLAPQAVQSKLDKTRTASRSLQDSKESSFHARALDEAQRLIRFQEALDEDNSLASRPQTQSSETDARDEPSAGTSSAPFVGQPLSTTLYRLVQLNQTKRAAKLATDFKIPDKTFWWVRLRAQIASRAWREIEELARATKKSPIGWEPFFERVLGAGNPRLAGIFVPKCVSATAQQRVEMYVKCGLLVDAGKEAVKAKDMQALEDIRSKASGGRDGVEIERLVAQLKKGK